MRNIQKAVFGSDFRKRISWLLVSILGLNLLFFHSLGSVALAMTLTAGFLIAWGMFSPSRIISGERMSLFILALVVLLACANIIVNDNYFIQFLSAFLAIMVIILASFSWLRNFAFVNGLSEIFLAPFQLAISYISHGLWFFRSLRPKELGSLIRPRPTAPRSLAISVFRGIIISLPLIAIFITLFTGADPIFESFISHFISAEFIGQIPARLILSLILLIIFLPFSVITLPAGLNTPLSRLLNSIRLVVEATTVQVLVGLVFAIFLIVQWPYVFASVPAETDLSRFGVATYSEYVRQGFGELLVASLLIYGLVWLGLAVYRAAPQANYLKAAQIINICLLGLFLVSIARRVWLYQLFHGLSLTRIYGSFLLVWIFGLCVFLSLRHFWNKKWIAYEAVFTALLIIGFGMVNSEHWLATYAPPTVNQRVDYVYLSALSADGFSGWSQSLDFATQTINIQTNVPESLTNRSQRQLLAYSGWILQNLSNKYSHLLSKYGQPQDQATYQTQMQQFISRFNTKNQSDSPNSNSTYTTASTSSYSHWRWINVFGSDFPEPWSIFYSRTRFPQKTLSSWDRLLSYNASEAKAYSIMTSQNWPSRFFDLQSKFLRLQRQILSQPESERDYEMDISPGLFLER